MSSYRGRFEHICFLRPFTEIKGSRLHLGSSVIFWGVCRAVLSRECSASACRRSRVGGAGIEKAFNVNGSCIG